MHAWVTQQITWVSFIWALVTIILHINLNNRHFPGVFVIVVTWRVTSTRLVEVAFRQIDAVPKKGHPFIHSFACLLIPYFHIFSILHFFTSPFAFLISFFFNYSLNFWIFYLFAYHFSYFTNLLLHLYILSLLHLFFNFFCFLPGNL